MGKKKKGKGQGIFKEFVAFINKGNALALAIGVIIGGAFGAIVTAINTNIISPLIALLVGDSDLSDSLVTVLKWQYDETGAIAVDEFGAQIPAIAIRWGAFIQSVIDFLLIAVILFLITKIVADATKRLSKVREDVKAKLEKKELEEGPAEEAPVNPEPAPAPEPEPVVDEKAELLKEIRDLLKAEKTE